MKGPITKIISYPKASTLLISYKTPSGLHTLELSKNGWCDLNDLDEFCEACIPGYIIGSRSFDQMVDLAKQLYRKYIQENKKSLHHALQNQIQGLFFDRKAVRNIRPSNTQALYYAGV